MIDINYSLRIAYTAALSGMSGVGLFYQNAPPVITDQQYIIIYGITNTDASTNGSSDTECTISLALHTYNDVVNTGLTADILARNVFNRIYPNPQAVLSMDGAQMVNTELISDVVQNFTMTGGRNYIQRNLTFKHYIFHRSDIS